MLSRDLPFPDGGPDIFYQPLDKKNKWTMKDIRWGFDATDSGLISDQAACLQEDIHLR